MAYYDRVIFVKQEDIDRGLPNDPQCCPIALALRRYYKTDDVEVTTFFLSVGDRDFDCDYKVSAFQMDFDEGRKVKPFKFRTVRD